MKSVNQYHFHSFKRNSYQLLSICVLILLIVISSCGIRKGLKYLLSEQETSNINNAKPARVYLSANPDISAWNIACAQIQETKSNFILNLDAQHSATATLLLYFTLVPVFLATLFSLNSNYLNLPVPYAWLNWPQLPLFLRNRLLLI